jgi:hypothetical protein
MKIEINANDVIVPGNIAPAQIELAIHALQHRLKEMLEYQKGTPGEAQDKPVELKPPDFHQFESGARRSEVIGPRYDLIPEGPLRRLAMRYTLGAAKYGEYNWQKGMPFSDTFNHIFEHLQKAKESIRLGSITVDDDLAGAAWGVLTLMFFQDRGDYDQVQVQSLAPNDREREFFEARERDRQTQRHDNLEKLEKFAKWPGDVPPPPSDIRD